MGTRTQNESAMGIKTQNKKVLGIETHGNDEMGTRTQDDIVKCTWTPDGEWNGMRLKWA
ncbi:phosphonate ABC transporter substrate-binding protein [Sesbania bispinosa]|nr:phosphonate ABC transporter substrate-binding protein [Sesbania bispinosa]